MNETIETKAFLVPGGCCGCGGALARNLLQLFCHQLEWPWDKVRPLSLPHPACHAVFFNPITACSPQLALASVSSCVDLGIMIPAETSKLGIRKLCSHITVYMHQAGGFSPEEQQVPQHENRALNRAHG